MNKTYLLSPKISTDLQGMWFEGSAYERQSIYSINDSSPPPVNYDKHTLKPHSITHMEAPAHTLDNGNTVDYFFNDLTNFIGKALVIKVKKGSYKLVDKEKSIYHWEISLNELKEELDRYTNIPSKIIVTTPNYPTIESGFHDPRYVLTLSQEAADYLISLPNFHMYGTSWKSSDFKPGSKERPIHNTLFKSAYIVENLTLNNVPEGLYEYTGIPLYLDGASESPIMPVLREL